MTHLSSTYRATTPREELDSSYDEVSARVDAIFDELHDLEDALRELEFLSREPEYVCCVCGDSECSGPEASSLFFRAYDTVVSALAAPASYLPARLLDRAWERLYTDYPTNASFAWYVAHNASARKNARRLARRS